jgi:hypothetical protein
MRAGVDAGVAVSGGATLPQAAARAALRLGAEQEIAKAAK